MNNYLYSATTGGFYLKEMIDVYKDSGDGLPDDVIEITSEDQQKLMDGQSEGKVIVADDNGYPVLRERPAPTREEEEKVAQLEKVNSMKVATDIINTLQDAVELGMATDDEAALLTAWKKYRVMLNRVDTSTAPDIEWPEAPDDVA
ncbi:tail fiber assembly protein [Pantoea sp. FN0307]|uniref:tail fiber assembly protein n=1 Tax=unclassified Pantoea TaxID=2630326 RepID=UPI003CF069EA